MDESHLEVLADHKFQASVDEVKNITLLDAARLANLWQLCRMSSPAGSLIEIGSYKGEGAIHISNSCPEPTIFVCDTFEGGDLPMDPVLNALTAPKRLSIDGDLFGIVQPAGAPPIRKACRKERRIDPVHHHRQPAAARNTVIIRQKSPQKIQMGLTPLRDVVVIVAVRDRPARRKQKDLLQRISDTVRLPNVLNRRQPFQKHRQTRPLPQPIRHEIRGALRNQEPHTVRDRLNPQSSIRINPSS